MSLTQRAPALDMRYPAQASQVAHIRRAVGAVAREFGAADETLLQIGLAVTEAATNAVIHAYRDRAAEHAGDVRIVVRPGPDGRLVVHVEDFGMGLIPRTDSPGMGLGLCLMAHETDCFEVRKSPSGGTEVILHFRL